MKSLFSTVALLLAVGCADAQQFSMGIRSGATYLLEKQIDGQVFKAVEGQTMSWEKGVFFRVAGKRLVFESSISHYTVTNDRIIEYDCVYGSDGTISNTVFEDMKNDYFEWSFGIQYALSGNQDSRFRHFVGLSMIPTLNRTSATYTFTNTVTQEKTQNSGIETARTIWAGINYTATYNITSNLILLSELSYKVRPSTYFSSFKPNFIYQHDNRIGLNLGIAYVL